MKILALLIILIVFLAGCVNQGQTNNNQENTTPSSTAPSTTPYTPPSTPSSTTPENATQPENVSAPKTYDVAIRNFVYSLTITKIKVGDSVRWTNYDVNEHTATVDDGSFDTGLLNKGESKTIVFNAAGTYTYHCTHHSWMFGKIEVE